MTQPYQATTYQFAPDPDAGTVIVSVDSSAMDVTPQVSVVPASGLWFSAMPPASTVPLSPQAGGYYLVVFESTGAVGFSYTLSALVVPKSVEEEPNDVPGMANPMTVPSQRDAQLSSLTDIDIYKVTVGPGDVGKKLHVRTLPGDFDTETRSRCCCPTA